MNINMVQYGHYCLICGKTCNSWGGPKRARTHKKSLKKSKGYHNQYKIRAKDIKSECRLK